ncbi:unnamed protein product [Prunus brigantina]
MHKSLVFAYVDNGSLDSWLYPRGCNEEQCQIKRLGVIQRLNISIDVAFALDYLYYHCETAIVHCDLKPRNVLLDEDMVAHVGDFGLARFLLETSNDPSRTVPKWIQLHPQLVISQVHKPFGSIEYVSARSIPRGLMID